MLGLAFALATLLVVQAVLAGFEFELRERVLGVMPHIRILSTENTMNVSEVSAALEATNLDITWNAEISSLVLILPTVQSQRAQVVEPAYLTGIDLVDHAEASSLFKYIPASASEKLVAGSFEVLLGQETALRLGVEEGDYVYAFVMNTSMSLLGPIPRQKKFRVAGVVNTNTFIDANYVYVHFEDASKLLRTNGQATAFNLQMDDPFDAEDIALRLNFELPDQGLIALPWTRRFGFLYEQINSSKYMLLFIFSLLVGVAAFNLISTVVVFVREREKDVAVLRTLGASRFLIGSIFLTAGTMIAAFGLALGGLLGWLIGMGLETAFPWINAHLGTNLLAEYFVTSLTVKFQLIEVINVVILGLLLSLLAALLPAFRATRLEPAQVLRYE